VKHVFFLEEFVWKNLFNAYQPWTKAALRNFGGEITTFKTDQAIR
jgi:hypothetical protein